MEFKRVSGFLILIYFFFDKCSYGIFGIIVCYVRLSEFRGIINVCLIKEVGVLGSGC